MVAGRLPSYEFLCQCFRFDPPTGFLTWRTRPIEHFVDERVFKIWNTRFAKTKAGVFPIKDGELDYGRVRLLGKMLAIHRIAWKIMTRDDPIDEIDHVNGIRSDNRWCNLRAATHAENIHNSRHYRTRQVPKGAHKARSRWESRIASNGITYRLGRFSSPEKAHDAYCAAAKKLHGEFANFGSERRQ